MIKNGFVFLKNGNGRFSKMNESSLASRAAEYSIKWQDNCIITESRKEIYAQTHEEMSDNRPGNLFSKSFRINAR
ncbi:MAG: hypothetical protein C4520_03280 [Candidatus Abyssobacteria bacterium SURF_5]|uniref:Uncharacterized protein n=1 Tax=Abyssobacteria bacterium (strain SURF_5) TaxID=2093360 RepID=A0A3A4P167_ABYX5|nr:MAG: hypothetical protein C4520_03280 [Candidatus Abyssubacteria bacterium SURF_5]